MKPARPNILLLMTDQQRWDALGCTGGWVRTPNLDRIAAEGIRFSNCVTTSPVCVPARVSMARGWYPHNTSIWKNLLYQLPPTAPTWMQAVRSAGYRTSVFGKTHLHPHKGDLRDREHLLNAYGLDDFNEIGGPQASRMVLSHMTAEWQRKGLWEVYQKDFSERYATKPHMVRPSSLPLEDYADVYVGRKAREYLEAYDRPEPWFCWVSFGGPHEPWDAPEPYASMYDPAAMPPPILRPGDSRPRPRGKLDDRIEHESWQFEQGDVALMRANYAGNVTLIDDEISRILDAIRRSGELDNTVIAFTSDHGEMNGDYGLIYKTNFLNGAVRVPLLLRTPETIKGPHAGKVCDSAVEWFDVGPTLVEFAGGTLSHEQFAKSLRPVLSNPTAEHRAEAISEFSGEIMIMDRRWKMAVNHRGEPYLLFDLEKDPQETRNLAGLPETASVENGLRCRILERLVQSQLQTPG